MELSIGAQTISITASALCALAGGLLYDLLRGPRHAGGKPVSLLCDLLFCLYCTASLFLVGMFFCAGRLTLWEPAAFFGVFCLYVFGISPSVAPVFGIYRGKNTKKAEKLMKKVK